MRDPNRIYKFCSCMATIWAREKPDLRFAQVVEIVFARIKADGKDPFYIEEDEILAYVELAMDFHP